MKGYQPIPFGLRMQPALKAWLTEQAQRNFRSLNAEIVHRLEEGRSKENAPEAATSDALEQ
jgi:hypothetical protein